MRVFRFFGVLLLITFVLCAPAQEVLNKTLLKADKLYIKHQYYEAVIHYLKYLKEYPRDYYATRQTAICYNRLNDPGNAIDYWPIVVESSEVTEKDYLEYAKSLLANNRGPEAIKVFRFLNNSKDKSIAAWSRVYSNPGVLVQDSADYAITELDGVNSSSSESSPVLFKDKIFYVLDPTRQGRMLTAVSDLHIQSIRVNVLKDSIHFIPSLLYGQIQGLTMYGQFCFSPDGNWMYFAKAVSNKELSIKSDYPFYKYQLFALNMNTLHEIIPEIIAFKQNLPEYDFIHPTLSKDGKRLYFASNMKGSMGGYDLYVCERENNEWTTPKNLGSRINTPGNEVFPHATEENRLYFSSDQRPGLGGLDIFYAEPVADGEFLFQAAKNIGAPMNTQFDDFSLYILKGGKSGYLSSNRKNYSDDDLYYFNTK